MKKERLIQIICALACGLLVFCACGGAKDQKDGLPSANAQETGTEESEYPKETDEENGMGEEGIAGDGIMEENHREDIAAEDDPLDSLSTENDGVSENLQETPTEENGMLEIHADDRTSISDDIMIAQIPLQEIVKGNPVLYDRFRIDGWVFEWLISDYADGEYGDWLEDGVLVISREGDAKEPQVIHVTAEGGDAVWVSVEHKFEYVDVNFDGILDLLICTGHHGAQGLLTYYCFLRTEDGFMESPTFTDIPNPAVDADNQLILSQWRNSAVDHSYAEFAYQDHSYVMLRELCEYLELGDDPDSEEVWVWTVNGEVIGRSDELSDSEIDDLIFNENSEWGIMGDRWRTLYNHGLTTDFSIYSEP